MFTFWRAKSFDAGKTANETKQHQNEKTTEGIRSNIQILYHYIMLQNALKCKKEWRDLSQNISVPFSFALNMQKMFHLIFGFRSNARIIGVCTIEKIHCKLLTFYTSTIKLQV